ncbi:translation initiation factor IF-2 N-terminal domain-containing protein [Allokutzneria sp. A3M-2-11 16]|uniref:translation initiation factor IF-2 N-terminal domain-containing protein n=1 Tax=Allokutzneria sp. A3M-2-11 16 TaxID=2962043 RepID=UPI0020B64780|nr:translation initiation factor IF-2 N-terminal domain-containing protein [Allokutzneria sp. A3M-2-11 16]MCP3800959.1 translation initiation factor IF-2 N-terminal domain-containing protein [Allokutzneria sp. A3M-2-11 16]
MPKTDTPAGGAGGDSTAPGLDLPAKLRVHALAKLLGASSREVMATLVDLGFAVSSAQSSITRDVATQVVDHLAGDADEDADEVVEDVDDVDDIDDDIDDEPVAAPAALTPLFAAPQALFLPPQPAEAAPAEPEAPAKASRSGKAARPSRKRVSLTEADLDPDATEVDDLPGDVDLGGEDGDDDAGTRRRRRRGRRGRGRGKGPSEFGDDIDDEDVSDQELPAHVAVSAEAEQQDDAEAEDSADDSDEGGTKRRRRRRRRKGNAEDDSTTREDDPPNTVVHVRESRPERETTSSDDEVRSVKGSTRLEAKRQRRRDGREAGRRRAPILSESEFLARREAVDRKMVVREQGERIQIAVLEDGVLVEHFVTSAGSGSLVGNVYLGRVQNVLPSMEAAFVDIGRGRNAVLYAGEVDWDAAGLEGKSRKIEQALSTGDSVLVQVTKDPVGHKGARLTTQISLPGRFLVYVPAGGATGISRKLPDVERRRLKEILKRIVPDDAGVIIRTAAEGVSEEALARDVTRLQAQWEVVKGKAHGAPGVSKAGAPSLLYEEPDLLIKVIRDMFTEDFSALVVQGTHAWETIEPYVQHVAPDLASRLRRHAGANDVFTEYRVNEQITKALDRKVWLPSGGYLVIDRTEAMTVIDVNTGKFTGSGGNLEETVTRNNLESAEEIVRQLRLRDIGGIIVIDFIDMVLESNRDLVLRRLTECLGRDRTRHQVAEVTSLGLVQMTRKRVGTGLLEAFSSTCEHCRGRGLVVTTDITNGGGNGSHNHGNGSGNGNSGSGKGESKRQRQRNRANAEAAQAEAEAAEKKAEEPPAQPEPVAAEAPERAPEPVQEPTAEPVSEPEVVAEVAEAAPPATERRRQRRRRSSERPSGPPKEQAAEPEVLIATPREENAATAPAAKAEEPAPEEPSASSAPSQDPVAAVSVTTRRRTSRRAASRPAGPPQGAAKEA